MSTGTPASGLLGRPERRAIVLVPHDPAWARRFAEERERIAAALGPLARRVEHIGSTAVPGLVAKPVVDVLVAVPDVEDEPAYADPLVAAGYVLRVREPGHRMLRTPARDVHVHVWREGSREVARHLAFRDRLRADAGDRTRYAAVKEGLAARDWPSMDAYADAKDAVVAAVLARAGWRG